MSNLARVLTVTTKHADNQDLQAAVQRPSTLVVGRSCALAWLGIAVAAQHPYTRCPSADATALTAFPLHGRQSSSCTCCHSPQAECRRRRHSLSCTQVEDHTGETRLHGASHSQTAGNRAQSASPAPPWPWSPICSDPPPGPPCPAWRRHASATLNHRPHRLMGRCLQHGPVHQRSAAHAIERGPWPLSPAQNVSVHCAPHAAAPRPRNTLHFHRELGHSTDQYLCSCWQSAIWLQAASAAVQRLLMLCNRAHLMMLAAVTPLALHQRAFPSTLWHELFCSST